MTSSAFDFGFDDNEPQMARPRRLPPQPQDPDPNLEGMSELDRLFVKSTPAQLRTSEELDRAYPRQRRDLVCPECGKKLILKDGKFGIFYGCETWHETGCKGAHNCHKDTAEPHGRPADQATRDKRKEAHAIFDKLWAGGGMRRDSAYGWMRTQLGLSEEEGHIGMMDIPMCDRLIQLVRRQLGDVTRFERIDDDIL